MASFGYTYFISQLLDVGAIQNVSDKRLTRISNISIGLVLAATAVGEFTDNEILQWVRKGRRMTILIKEQYDMFRDLSQYLMNCVGEDDFESWKELLASCRYVCPTKKTECSSVFGKVSQFCLEVKSTSLSDEAEEYNDNDMVRTENYTSSNRETSKVLNTKDKKEEEKQNSSKNEQRDYPRFVKSNKLRSGHFSTVKNVGQVKESDNIISPEENTPPLEKLFVEEKLEKNFGKHVSKKENAKTDQENPGSKSVFSTNDEYNLNYKVTSVNKEPTSIEEPCTSSNSASIDNSNLSLNNNEYDSDDSLEEEEMSVEIIDDGLGKGVNTEDLISVFNTLKENDLNNEKYSDAVDNEIKEIAKNVSEKLKDNITNDYILKNKDGIQDILADDKHKGRETEVVKDKKEVVKETITKEIEAIMGKESDIHEDCKQQDLLREREEDSKVNSISDIRFTVEAGNDSEIIEDKRSQIISPCHVPDGISYPVVKEVSSKDVSCDEDGVMISTKDDNALHDDNICFDKLKKQDVVDKGEVKEINAKEKVKQVKQSVNEEVVCEKKTDQEGSIDNRIKENISVGKGEFSNEFLEDLLFTEDTSDTDSETDNSEQTDITEKAKLIEYDNLNCNKNLNNEKLGKVISIQNKNVDCSLSKKGQDVDINISEKDLIATDISEGTETGSHAKEEIVKGKVILEKIAHHKDQESKSGETLLVENRVTNKDASNEEEEKYMKLKEFKSLNEIEREMIKTKDKYETLLANKVRFDGFENKNIKRKGELERKNMIEKVKQVNQSVEKGLLYDDANDYKESKTEETLRKEEKLLTETKLSSLEKVGEDRIEIIGDVPLKEIDTYDKDRETNHIDKAELTENENLGLDQNKKINEKVETIKVKNISDKNKDLNYVHSNEEQDVDLEIIDNKEMKASKVQSKESVLGNNENRRNEILGKKSPHKAKDSRIGNASIEKTILDESNLKEYIEINEDEEDVEILSDERLKDGQVQSNINNDIHKKNKDIEVVNDESPLIIDENIGNCNTEKVVEDEIDISKDDHMEESSTVEKVLSTNQQKQSEVMVVDLSDEDADIEVIEDQRNIIQPLNEKSGNNCNAQASAYPQTLSSSISNEDEITEINNRIVDRILQKENNSASKEKIEDELSQSTFNEISQKQMKSNILPPKKSSPLNEEDMLKEVEVEIVNDDQLEQLYEGEVLGIEGKSPIKDKAIVYGCENSILNTTYKDSLSNENVIEIIDTDDENEGDQIDKEKMEKINEKRNEKGAELDDQENEEESQYTPSIEEVIEQTKRLLEKQKLYKTKEKCLKKKRIEKGTVIEVLERKTDKHLTTCVTPIIDVNDEQDSNQKNMSKKDETKEKGQENNQRSILEIDKTKEKDVNKKICEKGTEAEVFERTEKHASDIINIEDSQEINQMNMLKIDEGKGKCLDEKKKYKRTEAEDLKCVEKHIKTSVTEIIDVNNEHESNSKKILKINEAKEKGSENLIEKEIDVDVLEITEKHTKKTITENIDVKDSHGKNENETTNIDKAKRKGLNKERIEKRPQVDVLESEKRKIEKCLTEVIDVDEEHDSKKKKILEIEKNKKNNIYEKRYGKETETDVLKSKEISIIGSVKEIIDVNDEHESNSKKILEINKAKEKENEKSFKKKIDVDALEITEKHTKKVITENIDGNDSHVINKNNTTKIDEANWKDLNKESIEKGPEADVLKREKREIEKSLIDVIEVNDEHDTNQKKILEIEKKKKRNIYKNSFKKQTVADVLEIKEKSIKTSVKEIIYFNVEPKANEMNSIQNKVNVNIRVELNKDKVEESKKLLNHKNDSKNHSDICTKDNTHPLKFEAKSSKYEKIRAPGEEKLFESSKEKHENPNKAISLPDQYDSRKNLSTLKEDIVYETGNIIEEKNSNKKSSITNIESVLPIDQSSYEENKNVNEVRTEMRLSEESIAMEDNVHKDKKRKSLEIAVPNSNLELPGRKRPKLVKNFGSNQNNDVEFKNLNRRNGLDIIIPIIKNCGGIFSVKNGKTIYSFPNPERANSVVKVLNGFRFPDKHLEVCLVDDGDRNEDSDDLDYVRKLIDKEVRRNEDLFTIFIKYLLKNSITLKDCEFYSSCWQDIYVEGLAKSFQYLQRAVNSLLHINTGVGGVYILVVSPSVHVLQWLMAAISKDLMLVKSCKRDDAMAASVVTQDSQATSNKIILSSPESAVELMLSSNCGDVSQTLSALILDDATMLMVKHYYAMRRLANLLSFTQSQMKRGLNIVAIAEEVVEENVKTLSQIFKSNFIIQDGSSTDLTKKPTCLMPEKEDTKGLKTSRVKDNLKCLSSRTEEDKDYQNDSSYSDANIGKRFQVSKDEALDSNASTSTSEEFTVTSQSSEVVSSTEIITQQIITKKTIVNTVKKHYTFGKNKNCSSHIIRNDHSDSSSDTTYDQSDQNPNRFENDRSNESCKQPNQSQNTWNCDSKNINQDCNSSKIIDATDRSVWRSGAITAGTIKSKERRESTELLSNSTSNPLENLPSHSKHDFTNRKSNILDQQYHKYKHSGVLPSTSNMEIASKSSREIVPKETFRNVIDPFREGISDFNHLEHTQNRNDSFRFNRYDDADRLPRYSQNSHERKADSYMISQGQYDHSRSARSWESSSDYSRDSIWNTQNLPLQGGSRARTVENSNMLSSGRGGTEFYNQRGAGAVGPSVVSDHSQQQRSYQDAAARFSPYLRQPRDRDAFHSGSHEPKDRDTFRSGQYGPRDRETFNSGPYEPRDRETFNSGPYEPRDRDTINRSSYTQRFDTSSDSDHRDRRRDPSGGYWK